MVVVGVRVWWVGGDELMSWFGGGWVDELARWVGGGWGDELVNRFGCGWGDAEPPLRVMIWL